MRILNIHAHFDDFELTAGGTFERWRRKGEAGFAAKVVVCTDGAAGHQWRTREETAALRLKEQAEAAALGGFEFELLRLPSGHAVPEGFILSREFLAALWRTIREFEPDYLFCPPLPTETFMGVHTDHWSVAEAVRRVAYLINVPHAFSDLYPPVEGPAEFIKTPVILSVYDGYMVGANSHDLAVDVEEVFDHIATTAFCHRSQLCEWLPWVGRHEIKGLNDLESWKPVLRSRMNRQRADLQLPQGHALEYFNVTAWGEVPSVEQLLRDLPGVDGSASALDELRKKLGRWGVL